MGTKKNRSWAYKSATTYAELRWSKWIESMRKDVECVFGILKGRFRVLKTGIRLHGIKAADKIWLTFPYRCWNTFDWWHVENYDFVVGTLRCETTSDRARHSLTTR